MQDLQPHDGFVIYDQDPNLLATSPTALLMSQQISLIQVSGGDGGEGEGEQGTAGQARLPSGVSAHHLLPPLPPLPLPQITRQLVLQERARAAGPASAGGSSSA